MVSAASATPLMKRQASTKSAKVKTLWSFPAARLQPGSALSRAATSASPSRAGRAMRELARRGRAHDGGALDVVVPDLGDVEALDVLHELLEGLVEGRQGLALAREWRGAREHVVLHVRVIDAALLDLRDHVAQGLVSGPHHFRALFPLLEGLGEPALQELVHAAQDRGEGPACEPLVLLVEETQRDEVCRLELKSVVFLAVARLLDREPPVHADDLERFLLEVVRFLRVEGEDLECDLRLRHEYRGHHRGLELAEHGAAMIAVRRPVEPRLRRHGDD